MVERAPLLGTIRRHAEKAGEILSEAGEQASREEGKRLFKSVLLSAPDSIFFIVPSNIGRSQRTRECMEEGFMDALNDTPNASITVISFSDLQSGTQTITKGQGKRFVITGMEPNAGLGFDPESPVNQAFGFYKELYAGSEEFVARTWVARKSELPELMSDAKKQFPNLSESQLKEIIPSRFGVTPEEVAIQQLKAIETITQQVGVLSPGHALFGTYIGHAPAIDFFAMAVMSEELNLSNFKRGQGLRKFLEASEFRIENGEVVAASLRGRSRVGTIKVSELVATLQKASADRRKEWETI